MPAPKDGRLRPDSNYPQVLAALASNTDECVIAPGAPAGDGYPRVREPGSGRKRTKPHILICTMAHGPRPEGLEVAHGCGNRMCINPRHLRWATHPENMADRKLHGTAPVETWMHNTKLTWEQVQAIRTEYATGTTSYARLGEKYGVTRSCIGSIVRNKTWKWYW